MDTMLIGLTLAFTAGLFFAASDVLVRYASSGLTPLTNLKISLIIGTPLMAIAAIPGGFQGITPYSIGLYALAGLLNFVAGRLLFYIAIRHAGATTASITTTPTVILSAALAWITLGEELTLRQIIGLILVFTAILATSVEPSGKSLGGGKQVYGVAAGLTASLIFALSTILVRQAAGYGGADPLAGATISYLTALIVIMAANPEIPKLRGSRHTKAMVAAAAIVAMAQMSRYGALSLAPVALVSMLIGLFPLHTALLAMLASKHLEEHVGSRHLIAASLAITGIILATTG